MTDLGSAIQLLPVLATTASREERDAHRQKWLDLRRPGIGASEIAAVLGFSPWSSRFSLWWAKREGWEFEQTEAQEWGLRSEPMLAQKFAEVHSELVVSQPGMLYQHKRRPVMLASPDLIAVGKRGFYPVELKTDESNGDQWGPDGSDTVPLHYRAQVIWQCAVLGAPMGWLVRYSRKRYTEHPIKAGSVPYGGSVGNWIAAAEEFMLSVRENRPPEPDGSDATTDALIDLYQPDDKQPPVILPDELAFRFDVVMEKQRQAKLAVAEVKNEIRNLLGQSTVALDSRGREFARRTVRQRRGYIVKDTTVDFIERRSRK